MSELKIVYWDKDISKSVSYQGRLKGYKVGYDIDAELPWVLVSKSVYNPIVIASFASQDDMEILLNADLERFK
jgi:hypothetical protein